MRKLAVITTSLALAACSVAPIMPAATRPASPGVLERSLDAQSAVATSQAQLAAAASAATAEAASATQAERDRLLATEAARQTAAPRETAIAATQTGVPIMQTLTAATPTQLALQMQMEAMRREAEVEQARQTNLLVEEQARHISQMEADRLAADRQRHVDEFMGMLVQIGSALFLVVLSILGIAAAGLLWELTDQLAERARMRTRRERVQRTVDGDLLEYDPISGAFRLLLPPQPPLLENAPDTSAAAITDGSTPAPEADAPDEPPTTSASTANDPRTKDVLELLEASMRYAASHPEWPPNRLADHRALGWSASRWVRCKCFIPDDFFEPRIGGKAGTFLAQHPDVSSLHRDIMVGKVLLDIPLPRSNAVV